MNLWVVAALVFALNVPFGMWRATLKKLSFRWFLSIHIPVPLVIALRVYSNLGWKPATFPVLIGAFFAGQYAGAALQRWRAGTGSSRR
ncbi:MAG TPA: hypothetical protein VJH03_23685 [Blastocatellia bacterium]|nr:hypothetical protein [Blastocatellia bacterium]